MPLAADTQRERALASLRHHYVEGRLDADELAARAGRAAGARTTGDLRAALRGLPWFGETVERAKGTVFLAAYLGFLAVLWSAASVFLLLALVVLALAGAGGTELLAMPGLWVVLSAVLVVAGSRRLKRR